MEVTADSSVSLGSTVQVCLQTDLIIVKLMEPTTTSALSGSMFLLGIKKKKDMLLHLRLFSCAAYRKLIHFSAFVLTDLWSN